MSELRVTSLFATATLLAILVATTMLLQTAGHMFEMEAWRYAHIVKYGVFYLLPPTLYLTYGILFPLIRQHAITLLLVCTGLAVAGTASMHVTDLSADGVGYHLPSIQAIFDGWNPHHKATLLWQNIYPSGVWQVQASIASLFGSIDAGKTIHFVWLVVAYATWRYALLHMLGHWQWQHHIALIIMLLSPVVLVQWQTHYVDTMLYLSGMAFLGAMLLPRENGHIAVAANLIMACAVLFMVNTKLSGLYHAVMLCGIAVLFYWHNTKSLPWRVALWLFAAGLVAVFDIGWKPYVTNMLQYGSLLHQDAEYFSSAQRPDNLKDYSSILRFFYSLFSITDGDLANEPAILKVPGMVYPIELRNSGYPDPRTSGFGPLFSLGFVATIALFSFQLYRRQPIHTGLILVAGLLLLSSMIFPEGWWARYVPFAFAIPLILLFATPATGKMRYAHYVVLVIFAANALIVAQAMVRYQADAQWRFSSMVERIKDSPNVFLLAPGNDYKIYTGAHITLQRRLHEQGIDAPVKVNAPCPRMAADWSEFGICF